MTGYFFVEIYGDVAHSSTLSDRFVVVCERWGNDHDWAENDAINLTANINNLKTDDVLY